MAPELIDSYDTSNRDGAENVADHYPGDSWSATSQEAHIFYNETAHNLTSCTFFLMKTGSPTGNAHAVLYAITGTPNTDAVPTGSILATSDNFDVSTLTGSYVETTFTFTGGQQVLLQPLTWYAIVYQAQTTGTLDGSNYVRVGYDGSTPTHNGNAARDRHQNWSAQASIDVCFKVYGEPVVASSTGINAQII